MPTRTGSLLALATASLWLACPLGTAAQEPPAVSEAVLRDMQAAQDQLARAVAEFDGPQQSRSIVLFDEIVTRLEALRTQGTLPPRGRELLASAYELRGRAYFGIGLQEKASENFRVLVQLKPDHTLSKEKVSPKVVDLFNSVKKSLVGFLAVSSKPPGAVVTLIGSAGRTDLGLTDFFPLEVLAGEYTVEVAKEGYRTEPRPVSIAPKATEALRVELTRTTASAFFVTEPAAVEVWVDGVLRITTSGALAPDLAEAVRSRGIEPARASARAEVGNLSLGAHVVEFRKKCHETVRRGVNTEEARDYEMEPVRLEESLASLHLISEPPGARIFINGEARGVTPADLENVCSGRVRVEVKHAAGRFIQDLVLQRNEAMSLDCPIRPSLAFLGVVPGTTAAEAIAGDVEDKIRENLGKISSLNFVAVPRETVDRLLEAERVSRKALIPGSGSDLDLVRKATERLATALEVQGFLFGYLPGERLQRTAVLYLLAAGNAVAEPWDLVFNESASYARFIAAADQKVPVLRPWSGLITVDTRQHEGLPVLRVAPGSPAAKAGVQAGELVQALDGQPLKTTADLLQAVEQKRPGDKLSLHVKGAAGPRAVELTLAETSQEIPLFDPKLLYNALMMDLRQRVEGYPGTEKAAFAWLNLGLCAMHFGEYAEAHDFLQKAKAELPTRPGLSQGTALYYLGLALEKLGYDAQALEAYRVAGSQKDATLLNNDGPAVAPIAARRAAPAVP
jgi:tetratricopeptide (TPR) repeat protein